MPPDATLTTPARNVKLNGAGHHQRDAVREQLECARHRRRNFLRPVPVRRPAGDELSAPLLPHPLAVIFSADWQGGGPDAPLYPADPARGMKRRMTPVGKRVAVRSS